MMLQATFMAGLLLDPFSLKIVALRTTHPPNPWHELHDPKCLAQSL
jgi:hypothetical protein